MIKAFFLLFEPAVTWDRIALARRGIFFILVTYLIPTLLLVGLAESWGLATYGKWQPHYQKIRDFHLPAHQSDILNFAIAQFVLAIATVFIAALLIKIISGTFREEHNYRQAFATVAYSLSPLFLLRLLDVLPMVNPWMTWTFGIILAIWVFYQGLVRVMLPDPTHAFGLYLSGLIVLVLTTGVARLFTAMYILGSMEFQHSWLSNKLGQWLGH